MSGRTGATYNVNIGFPVYLGSVVITENNGWRKVLIYLKSQLISDSFCVFFPLNSKTKKRKKEWDRMVIFEDWL